MNKNITLHDKSFEIFISKEQISVAINKMVKKVEADMEDDNVLFIGVLNGSFLVVADFVRQFKYNCEISFVKMSSYRGTKTSGKVDTLIGLNENLEGKTVIILEDIIDSGNTLDKLINIFNDKKIKSLKIATLFFKPKAYKKEHNIDYIGMEIENDFIVGYGLDYDGLGRNLPHVYKLKQ